MRWLLDALPDLQPEAERGREALNYGTDWFWLPLGDGRSMFVPMSTQYETPPLRWLHFETCHVDRVSGVGCTCTDNREETNDAVKAQT